MAIKRAFSDNGKLPKKRKENTACINEYSGFSPKGNNDELTTIDFARVSKHSFYEQYVSTRTPVILNGVVGDLNVKQFQPQNIVNYLHYDELLLVEKKTKGGFGSGTERIKMKFDEFMQKLKAESEDRYYLTTQYLDDDPEEVKRQLAEKTEEDSDDEEDDDDEEETEQIKGKNQEEESEAESEEEESFTPPGPPDEQFSDAESLTFSNLNDDFDNMTENNELNEEQNEEEIVSKNLPGEPLTKSEAEVRVAEFVQKPLTNLVNDDILPLQPSPIGDTLVPQQINLWIGKSTPNAANDSDFKIKDDENDLGLGRRVFGGGLSSGLHHDHADNLYIPIRGCKRFTIFAPSDAEKMYTVGKINKVYGSGVIDYTNNDDAPGWRSLRSDSAMITEVTKWRLDNESDMDAVERDALIDLIEQEEDMLQELERKIKSIEASGVKKDPPSFSKIPAGILHLDKIKNESLRAELLKLAKEKWPKFFEAKRMTVILKPGQMFYLPAGWFHEVTSFGEDSAVSNDDYQNIHIAMNYWYSPPDDKEKVYKDSYWTEDFKRTMESVKYFR